MASKPIKLELELDDRDSQKKLKALAKEAGNTEDAFEDTESAGKAMARAIERAADDTINEIEQTKRAVDALEQALDGLDADPQQVVGDLKRMGLTAQDIEQDADELVRALKRIDDVKLSASKAGFDDLDKAMGRTTDSGKASSVAIGGIGGSISELPGIGNLGAIAESIGQLAEGALEGDVNTKQLVGTLGILGGTAAAMFVVEKAMSSIADSKAFHKEEVEGFSEAVTEVGEGVEAVNKALEDTTKLTGRTGGILGVFEGTSDVTEELVELGYTQADVNKAIAEGGQTLDSMVNSLEAASEAARDSAKGHSVNSEEYRTAIKLSRDYDDAIEVLTEKRADYTKGVEEGTIQEQYAGEAIEGTTAALEAHSKSLRWQRDQLLAARDAAQELIPALEDLEETQGDIAKSAFEDVWADQTDEMFGLRQAVQDTTDSVGALQESWKENGIAVEDNLDVVQQLSEAIGTEMAEALQDADGDYSAVTKTASKYRDELTAQMRQAGATEDQINDYLHTLGLTPSQVSTRIELSRQAEAMAQLQLLQSALDNLPQDVQVQVTQRVLAGDYVGARNAVQDFYNRNPVNLKTSITVPNVRAYGSGPNVQYSSDGGRTFFVHDGGMVGPNGVESFKRLKDDEVPAVLQQGEAVITKAQQEAISERLNSNPAPSSSGTSNTYITQNFPAGSVPREVKEAQRRYARVQGPL